MIAVRRQHLDPLIGDAHDRDVESAAAEVKAESTAAEYTVSSDSRLNWSLGLPMSRFTKSAIFSGSATALFYATVPTITLVVSKKITEGVLRSVSEFGMICGFP